MQNRYFGDVGDFSKYGMLRVLLKSGLKVGINWYLFPDQGHNKDGKHTAYLVNDTHELRNCDVFLYDFLKKSISGKRHISIIENSELLGSTIYYSKSLEVANNAFWKARSNVRIKWFDDSLQALQECDVIFCDPDNGFKTETVKETESRFGKHISFEEMKKYYGSGKSLVIYHHGPLWFKNNDMDPYVKNIQQQIKNFLGNIPAITCLRWDTTAKRFYFWIMQPEHVARMEPCIKSLLAQPWGNHFSKVF